MPKIMLAQSVKAWLFQPSQCTYVQDKTDAKFTKLIIFRDGYKRTLFLRSAQATIMLLRKIVIWLVEIPLFFTMFTG